jgi:hypothetical protein
VAGESGNDSVPREAHLQHGLLVAAIRETLSQQME